MLLQHANSSSDTDVDCERPAEPDTSKFLIDHKNNEKKYIRC